MGPRPHDRRDFLAAGGAGALLCTLGGQKIFADREADVTALSADLDVPPKVRAAAAGGASAPTATTLLAANGGARREYWIQAEPKRWNIVPTKRDQMLGKKIKGGKRFTAFAYRAYNQGFGVPLGPATVPGPLIEAETGDTIVVNFRNGLSSPVTIHPHGVMYSVDMDGAYKGRYTDPGGFVQPGETFQYTWEATPGTEGAWIYHDHGPLDPVPLYKGLFGPMIVREKNAPRPDREFFLGFHSFQPLATGLDRVFWCVNGRAYAGNTETLRAKVGERVAFHVYGMDNDFHTFHLHGHRWENDAGKVVDNQTFGPGDSFSFEIVEDNPGRWFYHCHVFSHLHQGMQGFYIVE